MSAIRAAMPSKFSAVQAVQKERCNHIRPPRFVLRRVGGLEVTQKIYDAGGTVLRRVGGLEGVGGITCESSAIDEETEARQPKKVQYFYPPKGGLEFLQIVSMLDRRVGG